MMMHTIMDELKHFQAGPQGEGHLVVALAGQPSNRFEVTEAVRQGTDLVLQCSPVAQEGDPAPSSPREAADRVVITGGDALLFHALALQCPPVAPKDDPAPSSPREAADRVFIRDEDAEPLSFHDPRRWYEDLR